MKSDEIEKIFELLDYFKFCIKEIEQDMKILYYILSTQQNYYN